MHCRNCDEFFPLTIEYWQLRADRVTVRADRCRTCQNERSKLYGALRRLDPAFKDAEKERHRVYYKNWYRPAIKRQHPELLEAYDRDKRERERHDAQERRLRAA